LASLEVFCRKTWRDSMIRVTRRPKPNVFDERVRKPGKKYLKQNPHPSSAQFKTHAYWTRIEQELRGAYGGICAYMGNYVFPCTGNQNVEHFKPKSKYPHLSYDWNNYRFVCSRLNGGKGDYTDVVDPFTLTDGWFILEFSTLMVKPCPNLTPAQRKKVDATISRLQLNDDETQGFSKVNQTDA